MERRERLRRQEKGFTLIELIVSIAIISMVVASVAAVFMIGMKSYQSTNDEIRIQQEAQTAANQINDILMEAGRIRRLEMTGGDILWAVETHGTYYGSGGLGGGGYAGGGADVIYSFLYRKEEENIYLLSMPGNSLTSAEVLRSQSFTEDDLLVKYVSDFSIGTITDGMAEFRLKVEIGTKEYVYEQKVKVRNESKE